MAMPQTKDWTATPVFVLMIAISGIAWGQSQPVRQDGLTVLRGVLCEDVAARECVGPIGSKEGAPIQLESDRKFVKYWLLVSANNPPDTVQVVWHVDGRHVHTGSLAITNAKHRTWAHKTLWPGNWRVEARSPSGSVLHSLEFQVAQPQ